ncbi:MAG: TIGR00282 family metallophosphoesterase [Clostridiales bacterium]
MKILFIGDIVGSPGRRMVLEHLNRLIEEYEIDFIIANGENSAAGFGITKKILGELHDCGVDAFTMGNHTWDNKDIFNFIDGEQKLLRPANLPEDLPGQGWRFFEVAGQKLLIINLLGRVFLPACDCPFRMADRLLKEYGHQTPYIFVDFHGEATSEKMAMGWYLDGRVSAVVGTHTHVQTADGRILPKGTGYITDVGMCGPRDSILGVEKEIIIERFLRGLPARFETAQGDLQFNGVIVDLDQQGKCQQLLPLNFWQPGL